MRTAVVMLAIMAATASAGWIPLAGGDSLQTTVTVVYAGPDSTVLDISVPGCETTEVAVDSLEYTRLDVPPARIGLLELGRPEVPYLSLSLAVPDGAACSSWVVIDEAETLAVERVYPLQPELAGGNDSGGFSFDSAFYGLDTVYPGSVVFQADTMRWREISVLLLQVPLAQVNPDQQTVVLVSHATVCVRHSGGALPTSVADWLAPMYGRLLVNFGALGIAARHDTERGARCLVLAHRDFLSDPWLTDSLLGWMEQRGYEPLVADAAGLSAQELKYGIREQYGLHSPPLLRWVLLVGDADRVATARPDDWPTANRPWDEDVLISDHWYSDIDLDYRNFVPEIGVSRLSVSGTEDLHVQVRKILDYQRNPPPGDWLRRWTCAGHWSLYYDPARGHCIGFWRNDLSNSNHNGYFLPTTTFLNGYNDADNYDVRDALNAGTGTLFYAGHGDKDRWYHWIWPGNVDWSVTDLAGIQNGGFTPFVANVACHTGDFSFQSPCLNEAWMRKSPGGAVACLGATQGSNDDPNRQLVTSIVRSLCADCDDPEMPQAPVFCLGDIDMFTDADVFRQRTSPTAKQNIAMYCCLGDPSMPVWTGGVPERACVDCPSRLTTGTKNNLTIGVSLASGRPVEGALICLWKEDDNVYLTNRTNEDGEAGFTFTVSAGEMLVTITEGHAAGAVPHTSMLPYQTTISIGDYAHWTECDTILRDPSGKAVKRGGWMTSDPSGIVYAAKGNKTRDFYAYSVAEDTWTPLTVIPLGDENRPVSTGSRGVWTDDGHVYMLKGNRTTAFWRYDIVGDSWHQLKPFEGGRVYDGVDLAVARVNGQPYVYALDGHLNQLWRYSIASNDWSLRPKLPDCCGRRSKEGSWLVYDGSDSIYLYQAYRHTLVTFSVAGNAWNDAPHAIMPCDGSTDHKHSGVGSCAVWHDGGIYAMKGNGSRSLWRYEPENNVWTESCAVPAVSSRNGQTKYVRYGADMAVANGHLYLQKGDKSVQFWRFWPGTMFDKKLGPGAGSFASAKGGGHGGSFGEQAITTGEGAEAPRWSADGKYCVFSRIDANGWSQIHRRGRLDTVELAITHDSTDHERPVLDAQGKRVAMQVLDTLTGYYQIGKARVIANATVTMLTADSCDNVMPEWRPVTGSRIVYEKDMDEYSNIFMVDTLGTTETQLTTDNADHYEPSWVNDSIVCYIWSPDDDYDQVAKVNVNLATHPQAVLTTAEADHDNVNPSANGQKLAFEVTDAYGVQQVGCILTTGTSEATLTSGTTDKTEPDWSASGNAIYCANWTGITSEIGWVNPLSGLYTAVTDDDAIRDNVDVYYGYTPFTNNAIYEREECATGVLLKGDDGDGIYMVSQVEQEQDGQMGAGLRVLALDRAEPNPAASHVSIHWQLPAEAVVSLKVYNTAGQVVNTLVNGRQLPGAYTTIWDGTDVWGRSLAAGVYFYRLESDGKRLSRKVVLTGR
jgi:hypothetical protein